MGGLRRVTKGGAATACLTLSLLFQHRYVIAEEAVMRLVSIQPTRFEVEAKQAGQVCQRVVPVASLPSWRPLEPLT